MSAVRHKIIRNTEGRHGGKATQIAKQITEKAMGHLFGPLYEAESALVEEAYNDFLQRAGLTESTTAMLHNAGLIMYSEQISVKLTDGKGNEIIVNTRYSKSDARFIRPAGWQTHIAVEDETLFDRAHKINKKLDKLRDKANNMRDAIVEQINGRSTKEVMAEWPETAFIVAKVMDLNLKTTPIMKPLEELLARFLPALPAPTEVA